MDWLAVACTVLVIICGVLNAAPLTKVKARAVQAVHAFLDEHVGIRGACDMKVRF